ncbi:Rieske (2Fe-2S) protein [Sphingobacterium spiritivorum]|uniref:Rieske [2Fe-2S] domain protein n=1 Tax=Sphingobacterium spiritivorum ATCC 33861 TaxID=525373 RepID=D7VRU4_SPHSI|nr:Rieske 2Fe-2S domain-containing protein [Sphingobacterium spiritivorum]EFK56495.1 rieske [2Fe-2S] domain protein [Sphingobacterium spiritivorum ATCC 33861]QQT35440.1 Rieske 2Fe-2S domain-containing protein [Sphingobacterium spiritivorum]WQD32127.1 Rieske 2Fe-2S domain-containing protein [Sphingobacterium spiritivorum]SUJ05850.1 3-phenylpropionate dioxygenase ferredoxin subunit [Sphingobacterium spiritivorum]
MQWIEIPSQFLNKPEEIRLVKVPGLNFCLTKQDGAWVAFSEKCPHAGAPLSTGWCEEGRVICPYHRHAFSLKTGRGDPGQGNFVNLYPLKQDQGKWFVGIDKKWWQKLF